MSVTSVVKDLTSWPALVGVKRRDPPPQIPDFDAEEFLSAFKASRSEYQWTPDRMELEKVEFQPVFLYCNLVRGGALHEYIDGLYPTRFGDESANPYAFTARRFEMWLTQQGSVSFPVALESKAPILSHPKTGIPVHRHRPRRGLIKGRIFMIRSEHMKVLDNLKQNGVLFNRQKVWTQIPYRLQIINPLPDHTSYTTGTTPGEEQIERGEVWMYLGNPDFWDQYPMCELERAKSYYYPDVMRRRKGVDFNVQGKPWMRDEPYYFFNAKEAANK